MMAPPTIPRLGDKASLCEGEARRFKSYSRYHTSLTQRTECRVSTPVVGSSNLSGGAKQQDVSSSGQSFRLLTGMISDRGRGVLPQHCSSEAEQRAFNPKREISKLSSATNNVYTQ